MSYHLTPSALVWLSRLTDEFQAVNDLAQSNVARSGVSSALSRLAAMGLAEWRKGNGASEYRITDAGRSAISRATPNTNEA